VSIAELLGSIATRFGRRADAAGRTIEVAAPSGLVALVDRTRLEQALTNLVENALRHGSGTVRLKAIESADTLELHAGDQGQGLSPEFLERAFERFSRADGSQRGAGLGLAIVAAIAHAHGGTARASNGPTGGADVALILPLRTRASPE
jgi:signal transduction histidine kinase